MFRSSTTIKSKKSPERQELESLYQNIRNIRNGETTVLSIGDTFQKLQENHPNDWLLSVEIAELLHRDKSQEGLLNKVMLHLDNVKKKRPAVAHLIDGGLELIFEKEKIS